MNIEQSKENPNTMLCTGEFTIAQAVEAKTSLLEALDAPQPITLDLSGITGADLTCLQLLCSALKTAEKNSSQIALNFESAPVILELLNDAGFTCQKGLPQVSLTTP